MLPMVDIDAAKTLEHFPDDFTELLSTLTMDHMGNYIKTDEVALKIKKDKVTEARKTVRTRMRLPGRLYLRFREIYRNQIEIKVN